MIKQLNPKLGDILLYNGWECEALYVHSSKSVTVRMLDGPGTGSKATVRNDSLEEVE